MMDALIDHPNYLRDLAGRLRKIPASAGVDGYDVDRLRMIADEFAAMQNRPTAPPTFEEILDAAHLAAEHAVAILGLENPNAVDCGFAWVCLPGNASFARKCANKAKKGGDAARYGSKMSGLGWTFWKPGGFSGQAIGHHEAGARAFRDVLAKHGIRADLGSRYD